LKGDWVASKQAVLGLVIECPDYGYNLAKRLKQRCGPGAWSRQSVYLALDELVETKHVRPRDEAQTMGEGQRIVYEATSGGVAYFQEWMFTPTAMEAPRDELELKIVLARPHELPKLIEMAWAQEQECVNKLATLTREAKRAESGRGPLSWSDVAEKLIRDNKTRRLRLRVECLQENREAMKLFLDRSAGPSSRRLRRAG
jgi:DNA-binding PadR family transcriptional regulator